jgi:HD-like signal output (HDOD) protein
LHDVGKLVIGAFLAQEAALVQREMWSGGLTFVGAERAVLGTDHAEVGGMVARHWNLPDEVEAVARAHHQPDAVEDERYRTTAALVQVADGLAHMCGYGGADTGELHRNVDAAAIDALGIDRRRIELAVSETADYIREIGAAVEQRGSQKR